MLDHTFKSGPNPDDVKTLRTTQAAKASREEIKKVLAEAAPPRDRRMARAYADLELEARRARRYQRRRSRRVA
jgi:hypothetical protein